MAGGLFPCVGKSEPMDSVPPVLKGFRFHRQIAITGFSEIWQAEDLGLGRAVAVKIFAPILDANGQVPPFPVAEWRRRFLQEARIQAGFDHAHIVPVVALASLQDGRPAMVMQMMSGSLRLEIGADLFKPGETEALGEEARPRAISPARARIVLLEVLSALVFLHGRGIVHRDIKPRNLLLINGPGSRVKLTDFGMAKPPGEPVSAGPAWFGTPDYISPEQFADSGLADDRSDIFSLGIVGIRMVTGHLPDRQRLAAVEDMPAEFKQLLVRMLDMEPSRRPSASQAMERLLAIDLPPGRRESMMTG
ncbi:MAG: serine/threonine protein kinase [Magnetospirillum sp.]|nr:serine/threonine protein kinase [Magnetospirillum sp.]